MSVLVFAVVGLAWWFCLVDLVDGLRALSSRSRVGLEKGPV